MKISVVITTYNRPAALEQVLRSLNQQTDHEYEIVVGDDGSSRKNRQRIEGFLQTNITVPYQYFYQEDQGFRLSSVRNACANICSGNYFIFLDGDCVPRPTFVEAYRRSARQGEFLYGRRVLVQPKLTCQAEENEVQIDRLTSVEHVMHWLRGDLNSLLKRLVGVPRWVNIFHNPSWKKLRGCNFGVWNSDYESVNGFDEQFQGWGYEDADLAVRLQNNGLLLKAAPAAALVYHLDHPELSRKFAGENWAIVEKRMKNSETQATIGLGDSTSRTKIVSGWIEQEKVSA